MRIVHVGHWDRPWETEQDWQAAFEALGHEVIPLDIRHVSAATIRDAALRSGLLLWSGGCQPTQPLAETIHTTWLLADRGIPSATLHLDPWWGLSRGGCPWWLNPMFQSGTIFTASGDNQDKWDRWGKRHVWLPPAVRHTAVHYGTPRDEWRCDVAFVGNDGRGYHPEWSYRRELLRELRAMCDRNGWSFGNPGGVDPKIDRGDDMNDFYASATVTVGDSLCPRRSKSRYFSDRVFEAPGRGGFLIAPHIRVLDDLYDEALPMYDWGDFDGLETLIDHYLTHDTEREDVRRLCHEKVAESHTYVNRAETILSHFGLPVSVPSEAAA